MLWGQLPKAESRDGNTYYATVCIYRLRFHPLSRYPGPLMAKFFDFYGAYHASKTTLHVKTLQDHEKFGSVVRQGPNKLLFNSVNAMGDIYQNERVTKSSAYLVSQIAPESYGLFNSIDRHMHQTKRKLLGPLLSDRSIRAFEGAMIDQIDVFLKGLSLSCEQPGTPVNMTERLTYLTVDITGQFVFGFPLSLQTEESYRFMIDKTPNFFLNIALQLPFMAGARVTHFKPLRALLRGKGYRHLLHQMIRSHLAKGQDGKRNLPFMTDTLEVSANDEAFIDEILTEATFILTAGSDTMSACISSVFFYLSRNLECYRRITTEIRSTFSSIDEIRAGSRLAKCSYLRACIDEALRMSPPLPGTLWRQQVVPADGAPSPLVIDGHIIPPGTHIGVNTYAIHHNEAYFPEPFTYRPERFLEKNSTTRGLMKNAFVPFSIGSRACMGKSMAYLEASLVLARTIWHYDFARAPNDAGNLGESTYWNERGMGDRINEYQTKDMLAAAHDGPCLIFRPLTENAKPPRSTLAPETSLVIFAHKHKISSLVI
ncbi:cytochrome P450 [Nemania sp. NC0429]|nr:cytochrome P450 [Nemania sp. NC0429]